MELLKVGSASLNQVPLDWKGNAARILQAIKQGKEKGVSLLLLPELCITGYGCEDAFLAPHVIQKAWKQLLSILPHTKGITLCLGLPYSHEKSLYNGAALLCDGKLVGITLKHFLAGDGVHYEPRWFKPWKAETQPFTVTRDEQTFTLGSSLYNIGGIKVAIEICEDAWAGQRPLRSVISKGVDIVLNPSASHFAMGKNEVRQRIVLEGSRFSHSIYLYANLCGCESGRMIYDGGSMIALCGEMKALSPRLTLKPVDLITALCDLDEGKVQKAKSHSFQHTPTETTIPKAPYTWPNIQIEPEPQNQKEEHLDKATEFFRAVTLGLYDYMRKSHSKGFVLSLSGGMDSGCVAALIYYMVLRVERELGLQVLKDYLPNFKSTDKLTVSEVMNSLLTTVYQKSKHSGQTTQKAAEELSKALHANFLLWDISPLVSQYTQLNEQALGRSLSWEEDDLALQNIQARVRAPSVWMLANLRGSLLLSTSNRSEAAVGYATMDGDTCGGLSPIAGIDKNFIIEWMNKVEKESIDNYPKIPAIHYISSQEPTAELRPPEESQEDEKDLMPYPLLDRIEKLAIRDKKSPKEILDILYLKDQYSPNLDFLEQCLKKFFRLWRRNQWKRERYAPSFHLDDENLDPKTWCRYPILSGSFEEEFEELDQRLQEFRNA